MSIEGDRQIDDSAIRSVTAMMAAHMAMAREGSSRKRGWHVKEECDAAYLSQLFFRALKRGNLISAMNYLMMLWFRHDKLALNECASIVPVRESDTQLMEFYEVGDVYSLVDAQEEHIRKLQEKLAKFDPPNFAPSSPRA